MNMKPLLFMMTLTYSVSGYSVFGIFKSDQDLVDEATALFKKSIRALELGDVYSHCKYFRQASDKIYELKTEMPEVIKDFLISANAHKICEGY